MNENFAPDQQDPSEDDFNIVGGEIFARFSPWASWLGDGNPFAPTAAPSLSTEAGGTAALGDPSAFVPVTSGGITINLIYDAAALAAPASFRAGIEQAVAILAAAISDKITVNIKIDYSKTGGGAAAGPDNGRYEPYSWVRDNLVNNATPGDATFNALTGGSTIQGQSNVAVWNAQLKLWGVIAANDTTTDDGAATFAIDINPNLLVGVALHELTHAMGRVPYGASSQPDIFDFYRFTSPGTRLFLGGSTAPAAYFSLDGGNIKVADYGRTSDPSDFLNSGVQGSNDPFNEFYTGSTSQQLTVADLKQLVALGFHLAGNHAPVLTVPAGPIAAKAGQSLQAASLFGASDVDGDALIYYFSDNSPAANSGHFLLNGTAIAAGVGFGINAAQLAQLVFVAGSAGTSDDLGVQVSDGKAVSSAGTVHISVGVNHAPVLTVPAGPISAKAGQSFQAASLFGGSDVDGDALTYYFCDNSPAANSGHFVLNGTAIAAGVGFGLNAAQLAQLFFVAGAAGTLDDLGMQLFDGQAVSAQNQVHINTTANHAPVLMAVDASASAGQAVQASSLFSATDADNDALTYYFQDNTPAANSGHFLVNGSVIPAGISFGVNAAQLAQTVFVAGAEGTSDTVGMQVSDGQAVSAMGQSHINVAVNHAPVLTVTDIAAGVGQAVAITTAFSATDADNDPLMYYFEDNTFGNGQFVSGGKVIPGGVSFGVNAEQLADTIFVGGTPGTFDDVAMQVSDGHAVSSFGEFHINSTWPTGLAGAASSDQAVSTAAAAPDSFGAPAGDDGHFNFTFAAAVPPAGGNHTDLAAPHLNQDIAAAAVPSASGAEAMIHLNSFGDSIALHDLHPLSHVADYFIV
jgi:hypothetical protein